MAGKHDTCRIEGCESIANRVGHQLCEMHYYRYRRNGHFDHVGQALPGDIEHSHGYVLKAAPGHPRAIGNYRAYEHRVVFYDAHGEGPFNCHWCTCVVTWDDMHVDHLDADKQNNTLSNLVASCALCNQHRGHERIRTTMRERHGYEIDGQKRTLNEWAALVGISRNSIITRLKKGWSLRRAVLEPRGKYGPISKKVKRII
jgi:hypothetical protein